MLLVGKVGDKLGRDAAEMQQCEEVKKKKTADQSHLYMKIFISSSCRKEKTASQTLR